MENISLCKVPKHSRLRASFTVEASLLMTMILPLLLGIIYYGFYLHDRGVLNGASQEISAQADLNHWKKSGNNRLAKSARKLEDRTGPSRKVSSSVSVSDDRASVSYTGTMSLPGILPRLLGKSTLSTSASTERMLLHPADLIRKIRGVEYISSLLK